MQHPGKAATETQKQNIQIANIPQLDYGISEGLNFLQYGILVNVKEF